MFVRTAVNCKLSNTKDSLLLGWAIANADKKGIDKMAKSFNTGVSTGKKPVIVEDDPDKIEADWQEMIRLFGGK